MVPSRSYTLGLPKSLDCAAGGQTLLADLSASMMSMALIGGALLSIEANDKSMTQLLRASCILLIVTGGSVDQETPGAMQM